MVAISKLNVFRELKFNTFLDDSYSRLTNPSISTFAKTQRSENHSEFVVCDLCTNVFYNAIATIDDGEAVDDDDEEDEEEQLQRRRIAVHRYILVAAMPMQ